MDMMASHNNFLTVFFLVILSVSLPLQASTQKENSAPELQSHIHTFDQIPYEDIESGSLFYKTKHGYQAQLAQYSDFSLDVNGLVARVKVKQTFVNRSSEWLEAVYVFPLSENSAVDQMKMVIGERIVLGEIKKKKQAKKLYQQAKKQGKKASLVSQQRPNMFTTKVANIGPNEKVTIEIGYLEQVHYQNQEFSLRLPLTITPRFVAKQQKKLANSQAQTENAEQAKIVQLDEITERAAITFDALHNNGWVVADADDISPPQQYYPEIAQNVTAATSGSRAAQSATISAKISLGLAIENLTSLYHPISQRRTNQSIELSLKQKQIRLDQDFVLTWQAANNQQPQAAFFKTSQTDADYGLLMLVPPRAKQIKALPKEVVVIIDTSGSMAGVSIRQAKRALAYALSQLNPDDRFNVIAFNDRPSEMFSQSQLANRENIRWAQQWLHTLSAGGGTRMYSALELALKPSKVENSYRQVVFITDGAVGDEANLLSLIEQKLKQTRLHTVGIGSAPNSYFMSQAAQLGRGSFRYIGKVNEVHQQINQLFDDINQPVLTDLRVSFPVGNVQPGVEYYPNKIPDLYASQPLKLTVKLPPNSGDYILVQGILNQQPWRQKVKISQAKQQSGIDSLWARAKIDSLSHQLRRNSAQLSRQDYAEIKSNIITKITEIALKHQLVSRYTSFVAIELQPSRPLSTKLKTAKVANAMPKGSKQLAIANTALGLEGFIRFGLVMLICALLMHVLCYWWKK